MPQPTGHYIEVVHDGKIYRYYGYAHKKNATCIGEGDWRGLMMNGKELPINGVLVPADVLHLVANECRKQISA